MAATVPSSAAGTASADDLGDSADWAQLPWSAERGAATRVAETHATAAATAKESAGVGRAAPGVAGPLQGLPSAPTA